MNRSDEVEEEFLQAAKERGSRYRIGGSAVVADRVHDPVVGEDFLLISYVDPGLWQAGGEFAAWLAARAVESKVVVRSGERPPQQGTWLARIRYLRLDTMPDLQPNPLVRLDVRPARSKDDHAFVIECLRRATEAGYPQAPTRAAGARALASALASEPGRLSFVAFDSQGERIGQVTYRDLVDDQLSVLHGARTELVDAFSIIRPATPIINEMLLASLPHVALPVLGTVSNDDRAECERIIGDLKRQGWAHQMTDWQFVGC